jgi:hypothetical protein
LEDQEVKKEAVMSTGQYQGRNISNEQKEISAILVDIDGTLLPYIDDKFRHSYRCECGHELNTASLDRALPVFCPWCAGTSLVRNEPSLGECLSIVREIIKRNVPPYQGAAECLRKLAGNAIFYMTARDETFFKGTEVWLISNEFPYLSPHQLLMRESDNADFPYRLKARLIEGLNRRVKPVAIIDDDLSLIAVAKSIGVPFIWAPACWERNSYYGKILDRL